MSEHAAENDAATLRTVARELERRDLVILAGMVAKVAERMSVIPLAKAEGDR